MIASADEVLAFWLDAGPGKWFKKDDAFDAAIVERFSKTHAAAVRGELENWVDSADSAMSLILVLDQFSRNMFRDDPRAFAQDAYAMRVAHDAITKGFDQSFALPVRRFIYMPFMHSEDLADQERCIALCEAGGDEEGVKYGKIHADIIRRFGRFPHRNKVLGRATLPEEQTFLNAGGFSG